MTARNRTSECSCPSWLTDYDFSLQQFPLHNWIPILPKSLFFLQETCNNIKKHLISINLICHVHFIPRLFSYIINISQLTRNHFLIKSDIHQCQKCNENHNRRHYPDKLVWKYFTNLLIKWNEKCFPSVYSMSFCFGLK